MCRRTGACLHCRAGARPLIVSFDKFRTSNDEAAARRLRAKGLVWLT